MPYVIACSCASKQQAAGAQPDLLKAAHELPGYVLSGSQPYSGICNSSPK